MKSRHTNIDNSSSRCATKACPFPREYGSTLCAKCTAMEVTPQYFQGTSITAATIKSWQSQVAGIEHSDYDPETLE